MRYKYFSIIIPCYNQVDEIIECLESIKSLNYPKDKFEVIVVDDGSTDATVAFLKDFELNADFNLRNFNQANQGAGAAKNLGMHHAKGDFFIFIDSDVSVPKNWLSKIDRTLNIEKADAFGGPDSFRFDFPPLLKAINYSMNSFNKTGGLRGKKGQKVKKFYPQSFNMGISRSLWKKIGGYENLRHGQDIEFIKRILQSESKLIFIENAYVYHKPRINLKNFVKESYYQGKYEFYLYQSDKSILKHVDSFSISITIILLITLLTSFFSDSIKWLLILELLIFSVIIAYSMLKSYNVNKEIKPVLLLPLILPIQLIGYGMGFILTFIRQVILKQESQN